MDIVHRVPRPGSRSTAALVPLVLAFGSLSVAGCASSSAPAAVPAAPVMPATDPRVGLKAGQWDAAEATWNLRVVSTTRPSAQNEGVDELRPGVHQELRHPGQLQRLAGLGYLQSGKPTLMVAFVCPARRATCRCIAT